MFTFQKPTAERIQHFLATQHPLPFSYSHAGATRATPPNGYAIDHKRVVLGQGEAVYHRAVAALRRWAKFDVGWVQKCWPTAPIEVNTTVGILARLPGLWSLNACRIVYVIDETGEIDRYGFAYGTLPCHAEQGEERFTVSWDNRSDTVYYDILAFSRPHVLLAWLGYPISRLVQKRFAHASKAAMQRAIGSQGNERRGSDNF
jgi:uncharacterized protein (UPF0548 family)